MNTQKGCPFYGFREQYPLTHAIAATLSAGPVTFSDGPGRANKSLVMQTCRADGTLLKPDRPAMAIESTWARKAFGQRGPAGEVWSTHVTIPSCDAKGIGLTWHYVFANMLSEDYEFSRSDLFVPVSGTTLVAWEYGAAEVTRMEPSIVLKRGKDYGDVRFWRLSPALSGGWSLVGESNKIVGVARQRFKCVSVMGSSLSASLIGAPGETVALVVADPSLKLHPVECTLSAGGTAQLRIENDTLTC